MRDTCWCGSAPGFAAFFRRSWRSRRGRSWRSPAFVRFRLSAPIDIAAVSKRLNSDSAGSTQIDRDRFALRRDGQQIAQHGDRPLCSPASQA